MKDILVSWDEISEYLRVSRKTAQRMEKESELPIRRKGRGYVYAFRKDVDDWLRYPNGQGALISPEPDANRI